MFIWKNRKAAIETAANYFTQGYDVDYCMDIALGIDGGMFYGLYCKDIETITAKEIERFHHDVIVEIERRLKGSSSNRKIV